MTPAAQPARERFAHLARLADAELDVEEGAILIAAEEYPDLELAAVTRQLNQLGAAARERIGAASDVAERVEELNRYLFDEQGFAGASEFGDPRNSYLNEVLARRVGIPISLALVYIGVGRRAGLDLRGISFPGHFLVRCAGGEERIIDAYHGCTLDRSDCELRLVSAFGVGASLVPEVHLRDATPREILVRMLRNLQRIFAERGDAERLLACCDRVLLLTPRDPIALRDRAMVYEQLGWLAAAIADLDTAIPLFDDEPLRDRLSERCSALRRSMGPAH